jgi:hypothetical protein
LDLTAPLRAVSYTVLVRVKQDGLPAGASVRVTGVQVDTAALNSPVHTAFQLRGPGPSDIFQRIWGIDDPDPPMSSVPCFDSSYNFEPRYTALYDVIQEPRADMWSSMLDISINYLVYRMNTACLVNLPGPASGYIGNERTGSGQFVTVRMPSRVGDRVDVTDPTGMVDVLITVTAVGAN